MSQPPLIAAARLDAELIVDEWEELWGSFKGDLEREELIAAIAEALAARDAALTTARARIEELEAALEMFERLAAALAPPTAVRQSSASGGGDT